MLVMWVLFAIGIGAAKNEQPLCLFYEIPLDWFGVITDARKAIDQESRAKPALCGSGFPVGLSARWE
jgi:hypothetical protein